MLCSLHWLLVVAALVPLTEYAKRRLTAVRLWASSPFSSSPRRKKKSVTFASLVPLVAMRWCQKRVLRMVANESRENKFGKYFFSNESDSGE